MISIHTPAWGATNDTEMQKWTFEFQSTLPRGERRATCYYHRRMRNFNPHSRVGSDALLNAPVIPFVIFQSTLPRGERLQNCTKAILTKVNIYAFLHTF